MINFNCVCGKEYSVPEDKAGARASCVNCGKMFVVPTYSEDVDMGKTQCGKCGKIYDAVKSACQGPANPLQGLRLANPKHLSHDYRQVVRCCLNQVSLPHLQNPPQPRAPCTSCITDVCEASFQTLTPQTL